MCKTVQRSKDVEDIIDGMFVNLNFKSLQFSKLCTSGCLVFNFQLRYSIFLHRNRLFNSENRQFLITL